MKWWGGPAALVVLGVTATWPALGQTLGISGGRNVKKGDYTATVAFRNKVDMTAFCTGVIVGDNWVLTAGHCVQGKVLDRIYISTGVDYVKFKDGASYEIDRIVPAKDKIDVAMVRTKRTITSDNYRLIPLSDDPVDDGVRLAITGWGRDKFNSAAGSSRLKQITLVTVANCSSDYKALCLLQKIKEDRVVGAERGDSGAPVMMGTPDAPVLVGVLTQREAIYAIGVQTHDIFDWVYETMAWKEPVGRSAGRRTGGSGQ